MEQVQQMNTKRVIIKIVFILAVLQFISEPCVRIHAEPNPQPVLPSGQEAAGESNQPSVPDPVAEAPAMVSESGEDRKTPDIPAEAHSWFEKGVLFSVYGNYQAADISFQKAAEMVPGWSDAHFQLGVAYGENGRYEDAIAAINKAIALDDAKGVYYYGRGRVYLMSGDRLKAMEDFNKAADMGDEDANRYLEKQPS